jgi:hypothetical protein
MPDDPDLAGLIHHEDRMAATRATSRMSVPEMPLAGEDHRQPRGIGGGDHLVVAHRPAGLDHAVAPASAASSARRQRERTRPRPRPTRASAVGQPQRLRHVLRLARGDAGRIDPAHLPGADAHRGADPSHRRWRWISHAWPRVQANSRSASSPRSGRAGSPPSVGRADPARVAVLHQKAARHLPEQRQPPRRRIGQRVGRQQAQVLLSGKDGARAASSAPGAITTSVKMPAISSAVAASSGGSAPRSRRRPRSVAVIGAAIGLGQRRPRATPQGLACLMMAQAGPSPGIRPPVRRLHRCR